MRHQRDPDPRERREGHQRIADAVLATLFDAVMRRADTGIVVLDAELNFVLVNDVAAALHGRAAADHPGRSLGEITPLALPLAPLFSEVLTTGRPMLDLELHTPDGPLPAAGRWFRTSILRIDPAGSADPLVASIFTDITEQRKEADKLARLADLSASLTAAESTDEVAAIVLGACDLVEDAVFVTLALHDPERRALRLTVPQGLDPDLREPWVWRPLDGSRPTPITEAFDAGEAVYVMSAEEADRRFPNLAGESGRLGIVSTAAIPLVDPSGRTFGVLGAGWDRVFDPPPELRARLRVLADLCGQALLRARRSDARSELVEHLQDELLGAVDHVPDIDLAATYRPATSALGLGGDWYDVVDLAPRCTAIIVGDVVGHGVAAAAQMAQAKGVVRALTLGSPTLTDVFVDASRALRHLAGSYVGTAAITRIDQEAKELTWVTAGHLPPLLVEPGGAPELLWSHVQPPIGMVSDPVEPPVRTYRPGSLLLMYTDGLVERRAASIDDRLALLVDVVGGIPASATAEEARDLVVAAMVGASVEDDVAIVVARLD